MVQDFAGQHMFVRRHIFGGLSLDAVMPCSLDAAEQGCGDGRRHLVLDGENVLELSIVPFGPEMRLGLAVDELHRDPDAIRRLSHTSFRDVVDAEFSCDLLRLDRLAFVDKDSVARDHEKLTETRQFGDDVFRKSVGEKFLRRSPLMLTNGRTAIDGRLAPAWGVGDRSGTERLSLDAWPPSRTLKTR